MGFQIYVLPVDSRIKIKSSSQVNFLVYYGSINQSTFTKFWNSKFVLIRYGTLEVENGLKKPISEPWSVLSVSGPVSRMSYTHRSTQFSHIINRLLTSLVRSVLWNIRPLFFAWTSLLRRSVHTKKPRSDISQYRPHARSISRYYSFVVSNSVRMGLYFMRTVIPAGENHEKTFFAFYNNLLIRKGFLSLVVHPCSLVCTFSQDLLVLL